MFTHTCMHTHMYKFIHTCTHAHMHAHTHARMHAHTCTHAHAHNMCNARPQSSLVTKPSVHPSQLSKGLPPVLHYSEYKALVRKLGKSDLYTDKEIHAATDFLHQIGSILHFSDRKNNLDDLYFMDPHWLFDVMSAIVTVKEKNPYVRHGVIESKCLPIIYKNLLGGGESKDFLIQLVVLLDRFEIVLPLDQQRSSLLIPSMLPNTKPPDISIPAGVPYLRRHIVFTDGFIPPGFWSRMIARIMHSIPCVKEIVETRTTLDDDSHSSLFNSSHVEDWERLSSSDEELDIHLWPPLKYSASPVHISTPQIPASLSPNCSIATGDSVLKFWRTGLYYRQSLHTDPLFFRVESLENMEQSTGDCGVCITTVTDTRGIQLYGQITDICDKHLVEWYNAESFRFDHKLPCCKCIEENCSPIHYFVKQEIVDKLDRMKDANSQANQVALFCRCPSGHTVHISDIAPDILLGDIDHCFLLKLSDIEYSTGSILGRGGFGKVYRGTCRGQDVAIKLFAKGVTEDLKELRNETTVLQSCHHPSLAGMVGVVIQPPHFYLVLELAPRGTIKKPFVQSSKPISRVIHFRIAAQIAAGLDFLHRSSYIFRDLKADNILLWSLRLNNLVNCKLTDFGMVTEIAPSGARRFGGTVGFMAPEVISAARPAYDQSADIFSLGMVLYQMVARRNPYESIKKKGSHLVNSAIEKGQLPELSDVKVAKIGLPYLALIMRKCWTYKPECRPQMSDLLPLLCIPRVQLTIGVRTVYSQFSLRDACVHIYQEDELKPPTEVNDPLPTVELWVCLDGDKGAEVQVLNAESLKHSQTHPIGVNCQEKCMVLHRNLLWLATRDGLGDSKVDVIDAQSKTHMHTVWMRDCGPSCFCANGDEMYIGTQEGCVFVLNSNAGTSSKNRQKCLCDHSIQGLVVAGRDLWVSYAQTIAFHSSTTLKARGKITLPCEGSNRQSMVGELSLHGNIIWGVHTGGVCISCWDRESKSCLFVRNIQTIIETSYPTQFSEICSITAHCSALDVLWLGLVTGQILLLSTGGDALLLLHPFKTRIRFLVSVPSLGPCRSERAQVLVGGKDFRQIEGLEIDPVDHDRRCQLLNIKGNSAKKSSSSTQSTPSHKNTLLLLEAVEAFHAKQIDLLQSSRAWDSYEDLEQFEEEVRKYDHLKHEDTEMEFSLEPQEDGLTLSVPAPPEVQDRQRHLQYRKFSHSSSLRTTLDDSHTHTHTHTSSNSSSSSGSTSSKSGEISSSSMSSYSSDAVCVLPCPTRRSLSTSSPSPSPSPSRVARTDQILAESRDPEFDDYVIIKTQ